MKMQVTKVILQSHVLSRMPRGLLYNCYIVQENQLIAGGCGNVLYTQKQDHTAILQLSPSQFLGDLLHTLLCQSHSLAALQLV